MEMPFERHLALAWYAEFLRVAVPGIHGMRDQAGGEGITDAVDAVDACVLPFRFAFA